MTENMRRDRKPAHPAGRMKKKSKDSPLTGMRRGWVLLIGLGLTFFAIYLVHALYGLQVNQYVYYSRLASEQHWQRIVDEPVRGDIIDANGNVLASTTYVYTVGITPGDVESITEDLTREEIAASLSSILSIDEASVLSDLADTDATYIQLAKGIEKDTIDLLETYISDNDIGGIAIDPVAKRYYAYDSLAAQVIGFAQNSDGTLIGQLGIEAYYDEELAGTKGYTYVEVDNYSQSALPYSSPTVIEAEDGYNVVLNLDSNIQQIATDVCQDVYDAYDVINGVTAIVMDPHTGAVLASVSCPDFDLNNPRSKPDWMSLDAWNAIPATVDSDESESTTTTPTPTSTPTPTNDPNQEVQTETIESEPTEGQMNFLMSSVWRNRTISDTYEPGSTFKALTTAIAFEEGLTTEDEMFSDAPIQVSDVDTIHCWREYHGGNHGTETLTEAFENSCNPIFVQLAWRIGIDLYYEYVHNFGFYDPTGIDLPAEGVGIFHTDPTKIDLATLSFGESSTVTPIQLASIYCALVNGGTLMTPQIADYLTDQDGNIVMDYEPVVIRKVFSEETAERVMKLMEGVVQDGTGSAGYVEGYSVAGKTSTSTIENGEYAGYHVLSFGCYAPSDDPEIVVLVVVNMPASKDVASSCASRAAARIVSGTLEYLGVERKYVEDDYTKLTTQYTVPNVVGMTYGEAMSTLYTNAGAFDAVKGNDTISDDTVITSMYPAADSLLYKTGQVVLYSSAVTDTGQMPQVVVPDFSGKTISECITEASKCGVNIHLSGNYAGVAVSQSVSGSSGDSAAATPTPTPTPSPAVTPTGTPADNSGQDTSVDDSGGTVSQKVPAGTVIEIVME